MTVLRWHADADDRLRNSGDDIDRHQRAVLVLVHEIAAAIGLPLHASALPDAARWHDEGERITGDVPYAIKRADPALLAALDAAEARAMAGMDLPGYPWILTDREAAVMKLADRAEAWLWAALHTDTYAPRWRTHWAEVNALAVQIGPRAADWWRRASGGRT